MVGGALICKYLPREEQLKLISDLIQNDSLEEVLELIETSPLDITTDSNIETPIFEKITEQVIAYASIDGEAREMFRSSRNEMNKTLRTSAQLLCSLPSVWHKFQVWMSYRLNDIISENYKHLFNDNFGKKIVQPFFDSFAEEQNANIKHENLHLDIPVSYTHLDVYKRQS